MRDAGTIEVGLPPANSVVIRLDGIKAHEADETCKTKDAAWPCGAKARAALASFIRYRAVTCAVPPGGQIKDFTMRCSVVGQGWAMPKAGAEPDLAKALDAAKTERLGLWRTD